MAKGRNSKPAKGPAEPERSEEERAKIRNALAILKGQIVSKPKEHKGEKVKCLWKEDRIVFPKGGARKMKDFRAAKAYAEKNGYKLE